MNPLVSILIPAYNAEPWIADTIRSALGQSWPNKEIIVVDDGSKDRTLAVARQFASPTVKVVTQENGGVCTARNHAFSLAQGEFIQWLDADDLMAPDKIERQMQEVLKTSSRRTLFSGEWAYFFCRLHKAVFAPDALWADLTPVEFFVRKMGQNLHMPLHSWLVSRELTEAAGPWNVSLRRDNDGEYFSRVILASDGIRFIPHARVYYRQSGSSSISFIGRSVKKQDSLWLAMQLHIRYLRSLEDSDRTRAACVTYLQNWFGYFYPERPEIVSQVEQVAASLGGRLEIPKLSWKYAWIQKCFGWKLAKQAQRSLPLIRENMARLWDKTMFSVQGAGKSHPASKALPSEPETANRIT